MLTVRFCEHNPTRLDQTASSRSVQVRACEASMAAREAAVVCCWFCFHAFHASYLIPFSRSASSHSIPAENAVQLLPPSSVSDRWLDAWPGNFGTWRQARCAIPESMLRIRFRIGDPHSSMEYPVLASMRVFSGTLGRGKGKLGQPVQNAEQRYRLMQRIAVRAEHP